MSMIRRCRADERLASLAIVNRRYVVATWRDSHAAPPIK